MLPTSTTVWVRKHFNWPQRRSLVVRPKVEVAELARGVGKTERITAPRIMHNAFAMRRSLGGLITPTFKKLLTEIIPSLYSGFDEMGYVENKHYFVGEEGPEKWDRPHKRMKSWKHAMHFCNGSGLAFVSQDRPTMGQGLSFDYHIIEEGRLIDGQAYEDRVSQTLRGNRQYFDGMSEHHSMLIVSDKPRTKKEKWFRKYRDQMDSEVIEMIFKVYFRQQQLYDALEEGGLSITTVDKYQSEITLLEKDLNDLRQTATYYHEGSVLDNIDVIGWDKFLHWERTMDPAVFASSLLNEDVTIVEGAWYSELNEDRHCYTPGTTTFTEAKGFDRAKLSSRDSRDDAEIIPTLPLDIALDYGGRFNCLGVGQYFKDLFRIDNAFHGTHPETTQNVVMKFVNHFKHHERKQVYYHHDDTAKDKHGTTPYTYYEVVLNTLQENDWEVIPVYIGPTPAPPLRHLMCVELLRQPKPSVMWNPDNCADMLTAMKLTQIKDGRNGIEKNKRMERGDLEDQVHAPHFGDCCDTLLWGRLQTLNESDELPVPSIFV